MPTHLTHPAASLTTPRSQSDAPRVGRTGILFGLTGVFSFVLGSLILTRPEPLRAYSVDAANAAVTAQLDQILGPATAPAVGSPGTWGGLIVQHAGTTEGGGSRVAHITVVFEGAAGPTVRVASPAPSDQGRPVAMVVAISGTPLDDTIDWRDDPTVRQLVSRLCDALKIEDRHVRWS